MLFTSASHSLCPLVISLFCLYLFILPCHASPTITQSAQANEITLRRERVKALLLAKKASVNKMDSVQQSLYSFESRAVRIGLPPEEVSETYGRVAHLLEKGCISTTPEIWSINLADQILTLAAFPTRVNQGHHNTCALAALESRLYTSKPSIVAALVVDVATTGRFRNPKKQEINLAADNILPDKEAYLRSSGHRCYASQLFQTTAANIYWQSQTRHPHGGRVQPGMIRYVQAGRDEKTSSSVTGEGLIISWPGGVTETIGGIERASTSSPQLGMPQVKAIYNLITGQKAQKILLAHKDFAGSRGVITINSESSLKKKLSKLQGKGTFPVLIPVRLDSTMFKKGMTVQQQKNGRKIISRQGEQFRHPSLEESWHMLAIVNFNPQTGTVELDNWWGQNSDFTRKKAVNIHDLYLALKPAASASQEINYDSYRYGISFSF